LGLVASSKYPYLYILLGNDDGTFTPVATSLTLGEDIGSIAVGDFNGDGKADLAITNQIDNTTTYGGSSVSIFLGKGDGTFTAAPTIENPPVQPRSVVIGDFNGDGIQDLAVSGYSTQIFLGNGDGTFQPSTTLYASGSSITVGDFNGDGKADLAMVWPDDYTAYVYFGNGDGTFTQGPSHATGEFPWALTAGDFNGDGAADLAVTNAMASTVTVLTSQLTQTSTATASGVAIAGQGMHLVNAKYPGDGNFGSSTSGTTELTAGLPTPSINWATPAAITYGTALSGIQLNASSPVAGTFTYSPAAGSMLGAGPQTLEVTFNPTDTAAYGSATTTVTLQVKQATPMITWATPAAVAYGTALSATQLDATASVPGTFVYNPASGVIPSAGNDTLSVTFTPTDAVDYTTATANVTLTVNPNPLPFLGNMTPAIADAGGAAFTITVNGANFLPNSTVYWGTSALATQYVSASQLTATVTAADIAIPGATAINVQTPAPGGGTSDILQFEVDSPAATATAPTVPSTVVSITAGSTATYSISFPAAVTSATATCLNLPAGAICSYSSATKMLTITTASTTPAGTYQVTVVFSETVASTASAGIFLPFLLLPLFFLRKKLTSRGIWSAAFLGLILLATTAFSIGCGGSSSTTSTQSTQSVTSSGVVALTVQ
jgi:hypothetical protein